MTIAVETLAYTGAAAVAYSERASASSGDGGVRSTSPASAGAETVASSERVAAVAHATTWSLRSAPSLH